MGSQSALELPALPRELMVSGLLGLSPLAWNLLPQGPISGQLFLNPRTSVTAPPPNTHGVLNTPAGGRSIILVR